jgi:hypothetical protein
MWRGSLKRGRRGRIVAVAVLGTLVVLAIGATAGAQKTTIHSGHLILTIEGKVKPTALPKSTLAPITLEVGGQMSTDDGSIPPALKEVIVDTDKNGTVNAKGFAVCKPSKLQSTTTKQAEKACPTSIVGTGLTHVSIAFAESSPVPVTSKLVAFNGGVKGGVTTILIHAYITVPTPAAIVTTVKITKEHKGPYGLHSIASVPKIAGGAGSVTSFHLKFHRIFTYRGKQQSYFEAKCANGRFLAEAEAIFRSGEKIGGEIVVPCQSKG